jgi:DNA-directed RNA polymerase subunit omega
MRTEEITAKALEQVNFDKYLLSIAVGKRAEELSKGATPLLEIDTDGMKYTDIALLEIAEGKLSVSLEG